MGFHGFLERPLNVCVNFGGCVGSILRLKFGTERKDLGDKPHLSSFVWKSTIEAMLSVLNPLRSINAYALRITHIILNY